MEEICSFETLGPTYRSIWGRKFYFKDKKIRPDDWGSIFLRNVAKHLYYRVSYDKNTLQLQIPSKIVFHETEKSFRITGSADTGV
jgi:hypothetical protein